MRGARRGGPWDLNGTRWIRNAVFARSGKFEAIWWRLREEWVVSWWGR